MACTASLQRSVLFDIECQKEDPLVFVGACGEGASICLLVSAGLREGSDHHRLPRVYDERRGRLRELDRAPIVDCCVCTGEFKLNATVSQYPGPSTEAALRLGDSRDQTTEVIAPFEWHRAPTTDVPDLSALNPEFSRKVSRLLCSILAPLAPRKRRGRDAPHSDAHLGFPHDFEPCTGQFRKAERAVPQAHDRHRSILPTQQAERLRNGVRGADQDERIAPRIQERLAFASDRGFGNGQEFLGETVSGCEDLGHSLGSGVCCDESQ